MQKICQTYDITHLSLFGSFAKGTQNAQSDIDLLIEFGRPTGLFTFVQIQDELTETFGRPLDLVTPKFISPHFRDDVLRDKLVIYEAI